MMRQFRNSSSQRKKYNSEIQTRHYLQCTSYNIECRYEMNISKDSSNRKEKPTYAHTFNQGRQHQNTRTHCFKVLAKYVHKKRHQMWAFNKTYTSAFRINIHVRTYAHILFYSRCVKINGRKPTGLQTVWESNYTIRI